MQSRHTQQKEVPKNDEKIFFCLWHKKEKKNSFPTMRPTRAGRWFASKPLPAWCGNQILQSSRRSDEKSCTCTYCLAAKFFLPLHSPEVRSDGDGSFLSFEKTKIISPSNRPSKCGKFHDFPAILADVVTPTPIPVTSSPTEALVGRERIVSIGVDVNGRRKSEF